MGVDLFDAGAFEPARDVFRLLLLQRSDDDSVWYWLGRCHQELGQEETALALYTCAGRAGRSRVFGALARGLHRVDDRKGRDR